jgi:hypothetical protein
MSETPPRGSADDELPAAARVALSTLLEPDERIEREAAAVAAHLFLTDRRLVVVRSGFDFRPASGIRSWPLDPELEVELEAGQLRIGLRGRVASVFYHESQSREIRSLVAAARGGDRGTV